jgi:hypothetical protein
VEASLASIASGHPDNPVTETGVLSEFSHHGLSSRLGRKRTDVKHQLLDPIIVAVPQALRGLLLYSVAKAVVRRVHRAHA